MKQWTLQPFAVYISYLDTCNEINKQFAKKPVSRFFRTRVSVQITDIHQSLLEIIVFIVYAECRTECGGDAAVRPGTGRRTGRVNTPPRLYNRDTRKNASGSTY